MTQIRIEDVWPLSPLQEGLLFHAWYDERARDVYVGQHILDLAEPLDTGLLRTSWQALLDRHASLRAGFQQPTGAQQLVQVIASGVRVPWRELDLSGRPAAEAAEELARAAEQERSRNFDLSVPPLLRLLLVKLAGGEYRLVVSMHHIVLDGWSSPILFDELARIYAAGGDAGGLPPVTPYREYLAWLARQDKDAARRAWRRALSGLTEPTRVGPAEPPSAPVMPHYVTVRATEELTERLRSLAGGRGLTLNTVVQGAWGLVLGKITGRADVAFGATVAGRPAELPGVERMLGLFTNTVPVRVRLEAGEPFGELLARLQGEQSELLAHQHLGLAEIQRVGGPGARFDSLMAYQNYPRVGGGGQPGPGGLKVTGAEGEDASHYPLTLLAAAADRLDLGLEYRPDVFGEEAAQALLDRLVRVLEQVAADPTVRTGQVGVLSDTERRHVVVEWNDTVRDVPGESLVDLFEAQVARSPDAVAVVCEGTGWSYAELDARANRMAHELIARGTGAGALVGVAMDRSAELPAVLLGIMKAGAAYVPIDPEYPADRIAYMLGDARPAVVVCTTATEELLPGEAGAERLVIDEPSAAAALAARPATAPSVPLHADDLAYVIYTSGSTGRPKGVAVGHAAVVNQ
ncbi:condensation domain-containing protein, partial [Actinomadura rugatobispora]